MAGAVLSQAHDHSPPSGSGKCLHGPEDLHQVDPGSLRQIEFPEPPEDRHGVPGIVQGQQDTPGLLRRSLRQQHGTAGVVRNVIRHAPQQVSLVRPQSPRPDRHQIDAACPGHFHDRFSGRSGVHPRGDAGHARLQGGARPGQHVLRAGFRLATQGDQRGVERLLGRRNEGGERRRGYVNRRHHGDVDGRAPRHGEDLRLREPGRSGPVRGEEYVHGRPNALRSDPARRPDARCPFHWHPDPPVRPSVPPIHRCAAPPRDCRRKGKRGMPRSRPPGCPPRCPATP